MKNQSYLLTSTATSVFGAASNVSSTQMEETTTLKRGILNSHKHLSFRVPVLSILLYLLMLTQANAQVQEETITTAQAPARCDWACQVLLQEMMTNQYEMMDGGGGYQAGGSSPTQNSQDGSDWCKGVGPGTVTPEEQMLFNIATIACAAAAVPGGLVVVGSCIAGLTAFAESICSD